MLVYANVFIALCSAAQVVVTYVVFSITFDFKNASFILFVFLSTYLQYNMQRGYLLNAGNSHTENSQWITKHKKLLLYSVGASLVAVLFLCNNLSYWSIGIMVGAEVISTLYYLPPLNIRKYGYFKPLIIAAIWVVSCAVVPLMENNLLTQHSIYFLLAQFIFISVLCIAFDIKDMTDDYLNNINTYANTLGLFKTKLMCLSGLLLAALCMYLFKVNSAFFVSELVMLLITGICVFFATENKHRFYYYLIIDGMLLLQCFMFLIAK